jgi:tartrate dehydratase alpha subunit/fumarate hydratase class I-like protein
MAINFPAFLAGLKGPSQIMYCISQDTGAPVVVYKDAQNVQQAVNVQPWSGAVQETYNGNHQQKEIQQIHEPTSSNTNQQQPTIRIEAGNQVSFDLKILTLNRT